MNKKTIIFLFLLLCFISFTGLGLNTQTVSAKIVKGDCGKKTNWKYDTKKKTLKITGKGAVSKKLVMHSPNATVFPDYYIKKLTIGEGITAINNCNAFEDFLTTSKLKLRLPNSLRKISAKAFPHLEMPELHIPKNVTTIEPGAFYDNPHLKKITVSKKNRHFTSKNGVLFDQKLHTLVFYPQGKQTEIYKIPKTITSIKPLAFAKNRHIQNVILPKKLKKLGGGAFSQCSHLTYINLTKKSKISKITDYNGKKENILGWSKRELSLYEEEYKDYPSIAEQYYVGTFEGTCLQNIIVPDKIKTLPSDTYEGIHARVEHFTLGKNFCGEINTGDPNKVYKNKLSLRGLIISSMKVVAGNKKYCIKNKSLYSKDEKTLYRVFYTNKSKTFILDNKVRYIANGAFEYIDNIQTIHAKGNLYNIGRNVINNCGTIQSFIVDGNINSIQRSAFYHCSIKEFICKGNVKSIGMTAFYNCMNLKTVQLGTQLSYLGEAAFKSTGLESITVLGPLTQIPKNAFQYCDKLVTVTLPASVTISDNAFEECIRLKSIVRI